MVLWLWGSNAYCVICIWGLKFNKIGYGKPSAYLAIDYLNQISERLKVNKSTNQEALRDPRIMEL